MNDSTASTRDAQIAQLFSAVCDGDFTYRMPNGHAMAAEANRMMEHLDRLMLAELGSIVRVTMEGLEHAIVMGKLQKVSGNVHEQTSAMAAATEEMSATVQTMAEQAHEVGELSNEAKQSVSHGMQTIDQATHVMDGTIGQMGQAVDRIDQLKEISKEIEELLGVIRKISDQTNLLALNATIEAARAGDAGRGFAVVAGEVKDLSRQTAKAAESIGEKSSAIQHAVTSVVQSIGDISGNVRQAAESLSASQESMRTIEGNMQNVDGRVHEIRYASQDQATAAGEIAQGVATISNTSHELDQMAQLALDGTDGLERMLQQDLKKLSAFKINRAIIELAKTDHLMWKKRLVDMVLGRGEIAPDEVTDHRQCRLGKWYTADGQRSFGHVAAFTELDGPHAEVHKLAKRAVEQYHRGEHEAAIRTVEDIGPLSDEVIRLLDALAD